MGHDMEYELLKMYREQFTERELFDEILSAQKGDMWDGMSSKKLSEETKLMIQVFGEKMKAKGINW